MEIDRTLNYSKTNITKIVNPPTIESDNFFSIIDQYESQLKNNLEPDKIPIAQKNIFKIGDFMQQDNNQIFINQNVGEMQDSDEEMNDQLKMVEITSSGNIEFKRNKNFLNKNENNIKSEDNNNYLDFDNKAESISMTNNNIFINNPLNNRNYDFMLQDNPININDDDYSYKWRKLCDALRQNYYKIIKNNFLSILQGLIISKKNNDIIQKIEIEEINYNIGDKNRKIKSRNENNNNNNNNTTKNSINISDTRTSYDNLTKIVTTTQINNLTNSINSLNNSNLNLPQQEINIQKEMEEDEKEIIKDNYQETDISKILNINNIFTPEKFKNLIDFLQYKDDLFMLKFNNDSSNVRISLNSSVKKRDYGNIYTINEEDNESYDSLSLQKSLKNSKRVTPSKLDIKKNSFKDIQGIINNSKNNNFNSLYINKDTPDINLNNIGQKNNKIEEIRIGKNDDDNEEDEKVGNKNIISDINTNINNSFKNKNKNEKKILSIELDMNLINTNNINNTNIQNNEGIEEDIKDDKMIISENENEENEDKDEMVNFTTPKSKEKTIDRKYENINGDNNLKPGPKEFINFDNNIQIKFPDFNNVLNNKEKFEDDKKDEKEKISEGKNKKIIKEKNENEELLNNEENNENKEKNKYNKKTILIKASENNENDETFKKNNDKDKNKLENSDNNDNNIENEDSNDNDKDHNEYNKENNNINENEEFNINSKDNNKHRIKIKYGNYDINFDNKINNKNELENEINIDENINNINIDDEFHIDNLPNINLNNEQYNEKVILSSTIIQNIKSDSLNDHIISPKSSVNIINCEKEDNNNDKSNNEEAKFDLFSNKISLSSNLSAKERQILYKKFLKYKVIDKEKRKVLFLNKNGSDFNDNKICELPFFSYVYILKLCLGKKINLIWAYEIFIHKLMYKLEKNKMLNSKELGKRKKNNKIANQINTEIYNFERKLKDLRKTYKNLIEKKNSLNSKKQKEKLMKEVDITNKQNDSYIMFINLLFLIRNNIYNDQIKYNSYIEKLMNILKRNRKINKSKVPISNQKKLIEPKKEEKRNEGYDSGNVDLDEKNHGKEPKKANNKKIFFLISFMLPFFYAMDYYMRYIKSFN